MPMSIRHAVSPGLTALLLLALLTPAMAQAAARDEEEPIRVDAGSVEANEKTGAMVYSGNVTVEQGRLSIRADRIEVTTRQGRTELVRATGRPAKLRSRGEGENADIQAEADRVDYRVSQKKVDLVGHVTLRRGEYVFTADRLHYDLNSKSLTAAGDEKSDGRVRAVIQPKKSGAEPAPGQ